MVTEIFDSFVCACCSHRCHHNIMQIGLTYTIDPNILEILISSEIKGIKRPSGVRLSTSSNHNSYIGKSFFDICNVRHNSLSKKGTSASRNVFENV